MNLTNLNFKEVSETLGISQSEIESTLCLLDFQLELKIVEEAQYAYHIATRTHIAGKTFRVNAILNRLIDLSMEEIDKSENIDDAQVAFERAPAGIAKEYGLMKILEFSKSIKRSKSCYFQTSQNSLLQKRKVLEKLIEKFC